MTTAVSPAALISSNFFSKSYGLIWLVVGTDINDVDWTEENLKEMLTFANKAASIITTRKGALAVMPTLEEINAQ